jgi:uncharacterized membrane protein YeaQ/YmgE (transglycosylase-associated protein family)
MNPMLWLLAGAILGWLATIEMAADRRLSLALNVVAGVAGALLAGWLVTLPFAPEILSSSEWDIGSLLVSSLGAIIVLVLVNLFRLKGAP